MNVDRSDDPYLAMLDPNSLSPGRKRLFVAGMVLASFLASLDLTGESDHSYVFAGTSDRKQWLRRVCRRSRVNFRVQTGKLG